MNKKEKAIELLKKEPKKALMFCKKWRDLGKHKSEIIRGAECINNPSFYSQIGYNPEECINNAISYLKSHLGI